MSVRRQALIVAPDPALATTLADWLAVAGYNALVVRTFAAARTELDAAHPDLLVTEVKLGAYNGLQLAIRARTSKGAVPVIVIGEPDVVLQAEAERQGAVFVNKPVDREALHAAVRQVHVDFRPARRSPRKKVAMLDATIDGFNARVIDVSYEGFRLELPDRADAGIPPFFMLKVPAFNISCRAQRVWTLGSPDKTSVWCGAMLATGDPSGSIAWRSLVDSVPGWTLLAN